MSHAIRTPVMTREEFFPWAEAQNERYEFDGIAPVAMTGGLVGHSRIGRNLMAALLARLRGGGCEPLGPDAGVATIGDAVRYPDAVVTCTRTLGDSRLVTNPVVVFEVISPGSGRMDRIVKAREYQAVPSIRRYVIIERDAAAATVLSRARDGDAWTATMLTAGDVVALPEVGIELPLEALREGMAEE